MLPDTPTRRRWAKGEIMFRQGDPGDCMYLMLDGKVRLILGEPGHERELTVFSKGDFFGELAVLSGEPRSASAEVTEDATVLEIGPETFQMMVHDDLAIVRRIMEVQGQRVARTNHPIQQLGDRLRTLRVALTCLKAQRNGTVSLSLTELGRQTGLSAASVSAATTALEGLGVGRVADGTWVETADAERKLLKAMDELASAD